MSGSSFSELDLPEPIEQFSAGRSQAQFDIDIDKDVDIKWSLQFDEFISRLATSNGIIPAELPEMLWDFCYRRSHRYHWLVTKAWDFQRLFLFLGFLDYWENNQEWWESYFFNRWLGAWQPVWSKGNLSLDGCYALVELRHECAPEDVIDQEWFEEWEEQELWARGFGTFASFALFRAEFQEAEDWQQQSKSTMLDYSEWEELGENVPASWVESSENAYRHLVVHRCMLPEWFPSQDWYSPREWHDDLGWDICEGFDVRR